MWLGLAQTGNGNVKTGNVYSGTANHQPVNQFLLFCFWYFCFTGTQIHRSGDCKVSSRRSVSQLFSELVLLVSHKRGGASSQLMVKEDEPLLECKLLEPEEPALSRVRLLGVVRGLKCTDSDLLDPLTGADWATWAAGPYGGSSSLSFSVMFKQVLQNLDVQWMVENVSHASFFICFFPLLRFCIRKPSVSHINPAGAIWLRSSSFLVTFLNSA